MRPTQNKTTFRFIESTENEIIRYLDKEQLNETYVLKLFRHYCSCKVISFRVVLSTDPDDCQFDGQKMCYWKDVSREGYIWQRIMGNTPSGSTGPDGDHSTGNCKQQMCIQNPIEHV